MGYANFLDNEGKYDEAIELYERVAAMKPQWMRPLQCMAVIYDFDRGIKSKAKKMASRIL